VSIEIKICELLKDNNKISTKEIAEILGVSIITVKRKIKKCLMLYILAVAIAVIGIL
jgi:DeoR/GlpR family transcriptional regulator of sugar metabolism